MAKKKGKVRYVTRFAKKTRRIARKAKPLGGMLGSGLYGAFRAKVSNYLAQYTNKIPLGNISDEVGMLAVNYAANKFASRKFPIIREITKAGNMIEAARIGEAVATGQLGGILGQTNSNGSITGMVVVG